MEFKPEAIRTSRLSLVPEQIGKLGSAVFNVYSRYVEGLNRNDAQTLELQTRARNIGRESWATHYLDVKSS